MIIYSVYIETESSIAKEWQDYMCKHHINEVMLTGCFVSASFHKELECGENISWRVDYTLDSMEKLNEYLSKYADVLRNDVSNRFGNKFKAVRKIYEQIHI